MDIVFDTFEVPIPPTPSKQKIKTTKKKTRNNGFEINPKKEKILTPYEARLKRGCYGDIAHDVTA